MNNLFWSTSSKHLDNLPITYVIGNWSIFYVTQTNSVKDYCVCNENLSQACTPVNVKQADMSSFSNRWHGHITLNFTTDYMPHNPKLAKQTILEFLNEFGLIVGQDLIVLWSLVQTLPYVFHAHILVSKMPIRYAKRGHFDSGHVYDIQAVQSLLLAYGCYLDNRNNPHIRNQKKVIVIDNIEHSRNAENYILTQPRLDDFGHEQTVILHGNLSYSANSKKENSLVNDLQSQLELEDICASENSDNPPQKQCSCCNAIYPHTIDYFHWHKRDKLLRSQCRLCRKLSRMANAANKSGRQWESENDKPYNYLGTVTVYDMLALYRSQLDKNGYLRCCHTGDIVNIDELSLDHIDTFAYDGKNRVDNLGITSRKMNSTKHSKKLIDFARSQAAIGTRIKNVDIVVQQIMDFD